MSNPYELFATDKHMEQEGILLNYGDFKIKIARAGGVNKKYAQTLARLVQPYKRQLQNDSLDEQTAAQLLAETYAECVVLDWENVQDVDGKPLEFNRSNTIKLLLDLPELFKDIQKQANMFANFRKKQVEEDVKK